MVPGSGAISMIKLIIDSQAFGTLLWLEFGRVFMFQTEKPYYAGKHTHRPVSQKTPDYFNLAFNTDHPKPTY